MPLWMLSIGWVIDVFIMFDFMRRVRGCKYNPYLTVILLAIIRIFFIWLVTHFYRMYAYKVLFTFFSTFLTTLIFFKGNVWQKLTSVIFYAVILACAECISYVVVLGICGNIMEGDFAKGFMLTVNYSVGYIICRLFAALSKERKIDYKTAQVVLIFLQLLWAYSQMLLVLPPIRLFVEGNMEAPKGYPSIVACIVLSILYIIPVIFMARHMTNDVITEEKAKAKQQVLEEQKKQYDTMMKNYAMTRRLRHDCVNHLETMRILTEKGNYAEAEKYAAEIKSALEEL